MLFRKGKSIDSEAIEGRACAVINTSIFLSLLVASFTTGPLLAIVRNNIYIMFLACVGSFLAFFSALFVRMPDIPQIKCNFKEDTIQNTDEPTLLYAS